MRWRPWEGSEQRMRASLQGMGLGEGNKQEPSERVIAEVQEEDYGGWARW